QAAAPRSAAALSMTFDEQLQRSFGTLSDHVRDEIARVRDEITGAAQAATAEVAAQASDARETAVNEASVRIRAEADAAAQIEIARFEQHAREMAAASAVSEQLRAADLAAHER